MFETKESIRMITSRGQKNLKKLEGLYKDYMTQTNLSFMQEVFADLSTHLENNKSPN